MFRTLSLMLVPALILGVSACGGSPTAPAGNASLSLKLTDAPFADAKAVFVTFSKVTAHRSEAAFSTIPFDNATTRTCDLKKLQAGAEDILGTTALPAGDYTQIRLTVTSAALYFDNASTGPACAASLTPPEGASAVVTVPSGEVKLNRPFTLAADTVTTILLDFDGGQSIHQTSDGYNMTPVIGIVSVQ
jgi:hypothetical protein